MFDKGKRIAISGVLTFTLVLGCIGYPQLKCYATADQNTDQSTDQNANQTTDNNPDNVSGNATDNGVTDASLEKAREDAKEAKRNKQSAQEILDKLKDAKNNLENYVIQLDKSINELQIEIVHLEQAQKKLEETIEDTKVHLAQAQEAQQHQYDEMKERIQMVYESGNKKYLDVLLTATSMTDMLNKTEYVSYVSQYDYNILNELKKAKEQVANIKFKLDRDLESNQKLQKEVNEQKEKMDTLVAEKKVQIDEYGRSIKAQSEEVEKYMRAEAEAESIIAMAEQSAVNNGGTVYTGGRFTWPAPGNTRITSYFGGREQPVAGASTNHKGIDIACNTGDPIVAAAAGTVIVATYNYAEGNYVVIDHGGGVVTLYMHNSSLAVSVGESVAAGQTIAYAGSTGVSTGTHCHFGVRVNGTYVDPLPYLQG